MPSKLRVEMHLAIDENSSAVQRCLPLLFINIYGIGHNSGPWLPALPAARANRHSRAGSGVESGMEAAWRSKRTDAGWHSTDILGLYLIHDIKELESIS